MEFSQCEKCRMVMPDQLIAKTSDTCYFCRHCNLIEQIEQGKPAFGFHDEIFWVQKHLAYRMNFLILGGAAFDESSDDKKRVQQIVYALSNTLKSSLFNISGALQDDRKKWFQAKRYCSHPLLLDRLRQMAEKTGTFPYLMPDETAFVAALQKKGIYEKWREHALKYVKNTKI